MSPWAGLPSFLGGKTKSEADALERARRKVLDELKRIREDREAVHAAHRFAEALR